MSKFVIACPVCHQYVQASTGLFASRRVRCACGNIIDVKTERLASRKCPSCGNQVVFDQADGVDARCPVCQSALMVGEAVSFRCHRCGCQLNADSTVDEVDCPVCGAVNDVQAEVKKAQVRAEGIPAVIRYEGDNQTIVWKHPLTDFTTGTQLIVHESQEAVFFRNGEALDSFPAGRYTLETATLPKMNSIYQLPTQGTPFRAEVYFVNLTTQLGIKWGTPSKVGMFDPVTGIHVELGASGAFNLRVSDARRLLIRVVGTAAGLKQEEVFNQNGLGYFRTLIMTQVKANLAKIIKSNHISVLELDEHLDTISRGLRDAINAELASYGLEVPKFYVSNIVTPDDDPNFRRMKQQHADLYLKTRDEEIRKAEAEAAFERKAVEAQTEARLKTITAQGDADAARIAGQAQADIYRMQAEAEAQEMRMKGYTYQQETSRQVGLEAMKNGLGGGANAAGALGDLAGLGVSLGAMSSVIGMTKDALNPMTQDAAQMGAAVGAAVAVGWDCPVCGHKNITTNFCPDCGGKKPEAKTGWDCAQCGTKNIQSKFCPNCGAKKPEESSGWTCPDCGTKDILSKFCPNCGARKPEEKRSWTCPDCGTKDIMTNFCPNCGRKKEDL